MRRGYLTLVSDNSAEKNAVTDTWQMTPSLLPSGIDTDDPFQRVFRDVLAENRRSKLTVLTSDKLGRR